MQARLVSGLQGRFNPLIKKSNRTGPRLWQYDTFAHTPTETIIPSRLANDQISSGGLALRSTPPPNNKRKLINRPPTTLIPISQYLTFTALPPRTYSIRTTYFNLQNLFLPYQPTPLLLSYPNSIQITLPQSNSHHISSAHLTVPTSASASASRHLSICPFYINIRNLYSFYVLEEDSPEKGYLAPYDNFAHNHFHFLFGENPESLDVYLYMYWKKIKATLKVAKQGRKW